MKAKRVSLETKRQVEFSRNLLATNFARMACRIIYTPIQIFSFYTYDNHTARSNVICQFHALAGSRSISIFGFRQHNLSRQNKCSSSSDIRRTSTDIISYYRAVSFVGIFAFMNAFTSRNLFYTLVRIINGSQLLLRLLSDNCRN